MIENKVAKSGLITLNISEMANANNVVLFDLKPFLWEEIALKEKDFREALKEIDWSVYQAKNVGIFCSVDVIIPQWAYILVSSYLSGHCKSVHFGNLNAVLGHVALNAINAITNTEYSDSRVIIKGCGEPWVSQEHYIALSAKLLPQVKTLMYGEPCSTVPIFKKK